MAAREDIHAEAMRRFDGEVSYLQEERALCLQDRRFAFIAGAQWEDAGWSDMSENMIRVEVNKTALGLKRIQDDYRQNRVTVNFREVKQAAAGTADLLDGLFRADLYRCKGMQALDNAFLEGSAGGMGAWLLANELEDEYDPDSDYQRIRTDVIVDADQRVFFDGNSKLYDKSDADWAILLHSYTREAFADEFGDDKATSWPDGLVKPVYDWYRPNIVMVAWYYRVENVDEERRTFAHTLTQDKEGFWASEIDDAFAEDRKQQGWIELPAKKRKRRRISKTVLSGNEVLREKKWIAGTCIPIIPYYGQRVYIDNVERVQGHVRQAKDPQRIYNTAISKLTETNAAAPIERPIVTTDQIAGLEGHWAEANWKRAPYLPINPTVDENGNRVAQPPVGTLKSPELPPVTAALLQQTSSDIEQLTGSDDQAMQVKSNVSAEAMDIATTRLDERDGSYSDNFKQSMQRYGEVYLEMAKDVYFEEGREVETLDRLPQQGERVQMGTEILMEPYTDERGIYGVRNDLSRGKFMVIADVTEATATRRDKTVKSMAAVAGLANEAGDQQLAGVCVGIMIANMDGEGLDELQKWNRKRMVEAGVFEPNEEEKAAMEAAAQEEQQPDPATIALLAQAQDFNAAAKLKEAQTGKAVADTQLSEAKVVETLASAREKSASAIHTRRETVEIGREPANDRGLLRRGNASDR